MKKIILGTLVALACIGSAATAEARNKYTHHSYAPAPDGRRVYYSGSRAQPTGAGHNKYTTAGH